MCGIAGVLNLFPGPAPGRSLLGAMIEAVEHRGPDGFGFYGDTDVGLAHARLSIIDIAGGQQPIANEDGTIHVVFNGEIFNYVELRADLEAGGHCFRTRSDTEVIVHAYEQYGDAFVDRLNGQFAIALWDSGKRRLLLARDRVGIRPLFYAIWRGRLYFASEIKSLFRVPGFPRRLNLAALAQIFTYWTTLGAGTPFEGVSALPAGCRASVSGDRLQIDRYWDWEFPPHPIRADRSESEYAEELRHLLVDAVRLQLRADVPVGAYLSGGLDSAVITALIKHYTDAPLRTFSLTFDDAEFDESVYQRDVVERLATTHTSVRCRKADIRDAFPRAVWHAETPVLRTAPAPLMLLAGAVHAANYKVVLTGEGADEVFGGYDLFREAKVRRFWARAPHSRWRPLLLGRLYPYLAHSPSTVRAAREAFFREGLEFADRPYFAHLPRWSTTRRMWRFFHPDVQRTFAGLDPYVTIEGILPPTADRWPPLGRDQYIEAHTLLSGYLLSSQGDRMAMANSVEGRFPFLDHRVIEFANRLPPSLKIRGLTEKHLLKRAVGDLVPESVRERPKQPYRAPDSQSFFDNGHPPEYVAALFSDGRVRESGLFDAAAVRKLYEKCRSGRAIGFADNMAFIGILSTLLVEEHFVRRLSAPDAARPTAVAGNF